MSRQGPPKEAAAPAHVVEQDHYDIGRIGRRRPLQCGSVLGWAGFRPYGDGAGYSQQCGQYRTRDPGSRKTPAVSGVVHATLVSALDGNRRGTNRRGQALPSAIETIVGGTGVGQPPYIHRAIGVTGMPGIWFKH